MALKGQTIQVGICGAGGTDATPPEFCDWCNKSLSSSNLNRYCGQTNYGRGGLGGAGTGSLHINNNAETITIIVGKVGGGDPGKENKIFGSTSDDCAKNQRPGRGGDGGGHSSISDGYTTLIAGGGSGGGASCATTGSQSYIKAGGTGGAGGGGEYGGYRGWAVPTTNPGWCRSYDGTAGGEARHDRLWPRRGRLHGDP